MSAPRYVLVHGHFYQPPRENPWLEAVEIQDSAAPYHDWNQRITAECYEPNAYARVLDDKGSIARISSNYERISWNFGPTLLSWLAVASPRVYKALLRADANSQRRFSGHGSAMAQAYNHIIMPLASRRDKRTQVVWGLRDFKHRFGRAPEGMWLPETAVDLETLDMLADHGVLFTVLAPHQAQAVRALDGKTADFADVSGGRIDGTRAYRVALPSGRTLALFFYDGPTSRAVAFERLLNRGEDFEQRLLSLLAKERAHPQLAQIATDGETYGHHHTYGEMALAYALDALEKRRGEVALTNYGEFLARHPPTHEVKIFENTSWSCAHGVERWRSDCGCHTGGKSGWNQRWRTPLREAFDLLRDGLLPFFAATAARFLRDPFLARDDYIDVILDRSVRSRERFLSRHALAPLDGKGRVTVWKLLELQRFSQLMYTSCGWFFSDLAGPEPVQDIQYAGRVLQLAKQLGAPDLEVPFLEKLEAAKGNTAEFPTGRTVYEHAVKRARVDLLQVGAHHAISSLFARDAHRPPPTQLYCYGIKQEEAVYHHTGRLRLTIGRLHVKSDITEEESPLAYGAVYLGDHNVSAGVLPELDGETAPSAICTRLGAALLPPFLRGDLPELLRTLEGLFSGRTYSLRHMFRDEQRAIIDVILEKTLRSVSSAYQSLYENHALLMRFLSELDVPQPGPLLLAAEYSLNTNLRRALSSAQPHTAQQEVLWLLEEAARTGVKIDYAPLRYAQSATLDRLVAALETRPEDPALLAELLRAVELAASPPFELNLFRTENAFVELIESGLYAAMRKKARGGDFPDAAEWLRLFTRLGEKLRVRLPGSPPPPI